MMSPETRLLARFACLAVPLLPALVAGCSTIHWESSVDAGLQRAAQQGKRALVQFYSWTSGDCLSMDQEVFTDEEIKRLMGNFVPIRVDPMIDNGLSKQFNVQVLPTFLVIREDRQIVGIQSGKLDVSNFKVFLIKHSYN